MAWNKEVESMFVVLNCRSCDNNVLRNGAFRCQVRKAGKFRRKGECVFATVKDQPGKMTFKGFIAYETSSWAGF
ncbi:MAG: hypothetical protein UX91_C0006G0150 [Candidatus Amesbacteria bacterium GW2011_GWB1_47_19]|nr:MAG: hypothetical protein UW51_C0002G0151 [Candidatus Amesbacteria bacterium GW2011_GWA1_44_24]KKU31258.1 MAG: hypothetical protein UX46_C0006G0050 [Candidatus Amesbacteria bacterium GW2011_GWC1_46_24]KKU67088.1 MAG: hypothetical protein UX91_C0006G0150 [Candidatus Amesbacteria bacterium GW2011_GWB1_47_19]OGD04923.1 MAG: hypothetical protein A2379_04050 [Candidatus Amesbacteria bacterium RIFOXYB1_FULL_47_13]HBC72956.1 hypothetical protein [Candidatus Amesbacteria bacterium]